MRDIDRLLLMNQNIGTEVQLPLHSKQRPSFSVSVLCLFHVVLCLSVTSENQDFMDMFFRCAVIVDVVDQARMIIHSTHKYACHSVIVSV